MVKTVQISLICSTSNDWLKTKMHFILITIIGLKHSLIHTIRSIHHHIQKIVLCDPIITRLSYHLQVPSMPFASQFLLSIPSSISISVPLSHIKVNTFLHLEFTTPLGLKSQYSPYPIHFRIKVNHQHIISAPHIQ